MKFKSPVNFEQWTVEQTESQIDIIKEDIRQFNREINLLNSIIGEHENRKRSTSLKIGNKTKYLNQLLKQLEELKKPNPDATKS